MVYSLFATAAAAYKKYEVNPQQWFIDVLQKLNDPEYEANSQICCLTDGK